MSTWSEINLLYQNALRADSTVLVSPVWYFETWILINAVRILAELWRYSMAGRFLEYHTWYITLLICFSPVTLLFLFIAWVLQNVEICCWYQHDVCLCIQAISKFHLIDVVVTFVPLHRKSTKSKGTAPDESPWCKKSKLKMPRSAKTREALLWSNGLRRR